MASTVRTLAQEDELRALVALSKRPSPRGLSADEAYVVKVDLVVDLLDALRAEVTRHGARQAGSSNWGYVGDMGYIGERLGEIISSIAGLEE